MKKPKKYRIPRHVQGEFREPDFPKYQPMTFNELWFMLREMREHKKEWEEDSKERRKQAEERRKQSDERRKEFLETEKWFREFMSEQEKFNREHKKEMRRLQNLFTSQWGRLVESLVEGDLIRLLNDRGIPVQNIIENYKGNYRGTSYEFDIIAENGPAVVFVEVKTTLRPDDVQHYLGKLRNIKTWMPRFGDAVIYGAMAYLKASAGSEKMAENKGLFVIRATGDSARIINRKGFQPVAF